MAPGRQREWNSKELPRERLGEVHEGDPGAGRVRAAAGFREAAALVEREVPLHPVVGVEPERGAAGLTPLFFREGQQAAAMALTLMLRQDRDAVDQEMVFMRFEHQGGDGHSFGFKQPDLAARNARGVILQRRPWRGVDDRRVGGNEGRGADRAHGIGFAWSCAADHEIHGDGLTNFRSVAEKLRKDGAQAAMAGCGASGRQVSRLRV